MKYLASLLLLLSSLSSFSQGLVNGKVINATSDEPVSFVNIIITDLGKGTVSNLEGEFNFRLPSNAQDHMEVVFSHIGFHSVHLRVADLRNSPLQIRLIAGEYDLDQAIVLDFKPKKIMERAQDNLEKTQYGQPHEIDVFYRELIWANETIQGMTRAAGYLHSEGYHEKHSRKPMSSGDDYNFMFISDIQKTEYGVLTSMTGRPRGAVGDLLFPLLAYRLWNFNINWFDYELLGGEIIGDREVFVLSIKAKNNNVKNQAARWGYGLYGLLEDAIFYIDQEDYGIHIMELHQKFPAKRVINEKIGQFYSKKECEAIVKFRRDPAGKYFFTYSNYQMTYTDFGYQTENNPHPREIKEYAELYALNYSMEVLDTEQLSEKYQAPVAGVYPDRFIYYHPDRYNGWIFIAGKARYQSGFWRDFDYPAFPGERQLEESLSQEKKLEEQFAEFRNNQFYLLPILRKRHGLNENFWNRTGLQQHPAKF